MAQQPADSKRHKIHLAAVYAVISAINATINGAIALAICKYCESQHTNLIVNAVFTASFFLAFLALSMFAIGANGSNERSYRREEDGSDFTS